MSLGQNPCTLHSRVRIGPGKQTVVKPSGFKNKTSDFIFSTLRTKKKIRLDGFWETVQLPKTEFKGRAQIFCAPIDRTLPGNELRLATCLDRCEVCGFAAAAGSVEFYLA